MKVDLNTIIKQRIEQLNSRTSELSKLLNNYSNFSTIEFECNHWINKTNLKEQEGKFNEYFEEVKNVNGPAIYIFELVDAEIKTKMITSIRRFRSINNKDENGNDLRRATAKLPRNIEKNNSTVLYVGSVKSNFYNRIKQHVGLGHKHTYALHIKFWAEPNWQFRLHYLLIDSHSVTTDLESAIATQLQPLLGKREV